MNINYNEWKYILNFNEEGWQKVAYQASSKTQFNQFWEVRTCQIGKMEN